MLESFKRLTSGLAVLCIIVVALMFVGCSQPSETKTSEEEEASTPQQEATIADLDPNTTIEPTVIYDEGKVTVAATSLDVVGNSATVDIEIKNGSKKDVKLYAGSMNSYICNTVNDYMIEGGFFNTTVSAGKTASEEATFKAESLAMYGITAIGSFRICMAVEVDGKTSYPEPVLVKTSSYDTVGTDSGSFADAIGNPAVQELYDFSVEMLETGNVLKNGNVDILSETLMTNSDGEKMYAVELMNNNDKDVLSTIGDIEMNGVTVSSGNWDTQLIAPHCKAVMDINLNSAIKDEVKGILSADSVGSLSYEITLKSLNRKDPWKNAEIAPKQKMQVALPGGAEGVDESGEIIYESNGITIRNMGVKADDSDYAKDLHALFFVRNDSKKDVTVDIDSDKVSIGDKMIDAMCFGVSVNSGSSGVLDVTLDDASLEKIEKTNPEDISDLSVIIEIRDKSYNKIDEKEITILY